MGRPKREDSRIRRITLVALAAIVVAAPAAAHPVTSAKELYFAHRCANAPTAAVLACIHRGTLHWGVSFSDARYIANRESGLHPELCNGEVPGGPHVANRLRRACGLFQFMPRTWTFTPQGRRGDSRFSAKWASLAYGWMVAHGYASAWRCC